MKMKNNKNCVGGTIFESLKTIREYTNYLYHTKRWIIFNDFIIKFMDRLSNNKWHLVFCNNNNEIIEFNCIKRLIMLQEYYISLQFVFQT